MGSQKGRTFAADFSTIMNLTTYIRHFFLRLTILTAIATLLISCQQRPGSEELLTEAELVFVNHPDSTKAYTDLLRAAKEQAALTNDADTEARSTLLLARQIQWSDEAAAYTLAKDAMNLYEQTGDESGRLQAELTMAGLLVQTDDLAGARTLYNICLRTARELHDTVSLRASLTGMAELCLAEGKETEALAMARQIPLTSGEDVGSEALFVLANCYLQCDSLPQARAIYQQIDTRGNTKARYVALRHLTEIALLEGDLEAAPDCVDSAFATAEEVFFEALRQQNEYHRANLEQERRANHMAYRHRQTLWMLVGVIIISVLVIAYIISLSRHRRAIHHQRLLAEQRERELVEERLSRQEDMVSLLQNFIIEKSEILRRLHAEDDKKITLSDRDWRETEETLDSITGGFVSRLRQQHPEFREEDIQLCMLTRMHLSNQAIAKIYLITVSAVKHRKLKLKKDGFGVFDPEQPLDDVIKEI